MPKPEPITFLVPGEPVPADRARAATALAAAPSALGEVTQSVVVSTQRAAGGQDVRVTATPDRDVVVMHIDRGPALVLHPLHARDLLLAQGEATRSAVDGAGMVRVPGRLQWRGLERTAAARGTTRGFLGDVMVKAIEVIAGKVVTGVADHAASRIVDRFDAQVNEAVYRLGRDSLESLKTAEPLARVPLRQDGPILVLTHGTFSTTSGTF